MSLNIWNDLTVEFIPNSNAQIRDILFIEKTLLILRRYHFIIKAEFYSCKYSMQIKNASIFHLYGSNTVYISIDYKPEQYYASDNNIFLYNIFCTVRMMCCRAAETWTELFTESCVSDDTINILSNNRKIKIGQE